MVRGTAFSSVPPSPDGRDVDAGDDEARQARPGCLSALIECRAAGEGGGVGIVVQLVAYAETRPRRRGGRRGRRAVRYDERYQTPGRGAESSTRGAGSLVRVRPSVQRSGRSWHSNYKNVAARGSARSNSASVP